MKITAIKPFPVWIGHRNQLIVKVETDEGVFGWGESGLSGREKAVVGALEHYAEFLRGRDPFRIGALWQEMYRSQYFEGGRVLQAAISAIDIALHDIKGKALGVPVHQLLGGQAAGSCLHLRVEPCHRRGGDDRGRAQADEGGLDLHPVLPRFLRRRDLRTARTRREIRRRAGRGARGAGVDGGARRRLASPAVGRGGGELLPEDAVAGRSISSRSRSATRRRRPTNRCAG